jgi:hypothetical protein
VLADVAAMLRAGGAALARHRRLIALVYLLQLAASAVIGAAVAGALARALARRPMFDAAIGGDAAALVAIGRDYGVLFSAIGGWITAAALLWAPVSWYLRGGLLACFAAPPPASAGETAHRFGAGGAASFLPFARLALWSLVPWTIVAVAAAFGLARLGDALLTALTAGEALRAAVVNLAPAAVLALAVRTAADCARADIVGSGRRGAGRALARGFVAVATRPAALAHAALCWGAAGIATGAYLAATGARPLPVGIAAVALVGVRQAVAVLRFAAHVGLLAGQVELARRIAGRPA